VSGRVVVVLDWSSGETQKQNARFLEERERAGTVALRDGKSARYRSLTVFEDGTCHLRRLSAAAVARRLGEVRMVRTRREAREEA
jgi:hypothetical protein